MLLLCPALAAAIELQVNINGADKALTKNINADLHLQQASSEPKLTVARIHNLFDLAPKQIEQTMQAKGYYHSQIQSKLDKIAGTTPEQDQWIATFDVTPGAPTKIATISIDVTGTGKANPKIKTLYRTPKLIPGHIFTHADYEDTKQELLSGFNALGYLNANFTQSVIEVDRTGYVANIKFTINTGPQYVFGAIHFVEPDYPADFLIRFAPFKAGDPYELQQLIDFQNNMESADLFNKIRFDPSSNLSDPNDTTVPVDVRLVSKPKNRYTGSIGYGTDTGMRGGIGWLHRRKSTPGHKIMTGINVSRVRSNAQINYIIPGSHPATDRYVFGALGQEEKFDELYSRKAEISASKSITRGKTESTYGIWCFTETFRIVQTQPKLNKKYTLPTAKWAWIDSTTTDDFEFGTRYDLYIRGGLSGALSDNSVAQSEANAKKIFPLTEKMRLLLRGTFGVVASKKFMILPPSLRFFTGGDESVRGYAYNSLGPLAVPSDPASNTGGRYLLIGSGEIEHKLYDKISGVAFFDAGNAALNLKIPLAMGAGVGIRYKTPVGNFRIDVAKPLNTVQNKHWRVHVNFGTDF